MAPYGAQWMYSSLGTNDGSKDYRYSPETPMYSSAPAMSHAMEQLVGHADRLRRSLLFTHFRPEQWPVSDMYRPSAPRVSRSQIDAFIAKRCLLCATEII
jgi:hypothetical protein